MDSASVKTIGSIYCVVNGIVKSMYKTCFLKPCYFSVTCRIQSREWWVCGS